MVPPKLNAILIKISLCDATGKGSQRHFVRYVADLRLYPCSITGAADLGYLLACSPVQLGGPFGFCAFALLSSGTAWLSENRFETYSSSSAFLFYCWAVFYDGGRRLSRGSYCSAMAVAKSEKS